MNAPTDKQIRMAQKLFATAQFYARKNAARGIAPGKQFNSFQEEMAWLDMNPANRRDVSTYIQFYADAAIDAVMTLHRGQ